MPRRRNYKKSWLETGAGKAVIAVTLLLVIVGAYNYGLFGDFLSAPGISPPAGPTEGDEVYFKVAVKENLGAYSAVSSCVVYAYDEDGNYLTSVTTDSDGIATFDTMTFLEGTHVWLQARQAAPATADPYVSPLIEFIVGNGDPADTVSARNAETGESTLWVRDVTGTAPTMSLYDDAGNSISGGSSHNLTTSDSQWKIDLFLSTDDVWYGAEDFTDMVSGDSYIGGIWVVWKGTKTQQFEQGNADAFYTWSDPTHVYYAWHFDTALWTDSLRTGDNDSFSNVFKLSGSNTFTADTVTIDVFDLYKDSGSMNINNFVDGGAVGVTAATVYIV